MDNLIAGLLEANRYFRHDMINYLQVIWGYIQLGQKDEAVDYIQKIIEHMQGLSELNKIDDDYLAGKISRFMFKMGYNSNFRLVVPKGLSIDKKIRVKYYQLLECVLIFLKAEIEEEIIGVRIALGADEILFEIESLEEGYTIDWASLVALLEKENCTITQNNYNENHQILISDLEDLTKQLKSGMGEMDVL